jgi:hypothetical protein
LNTSLVLLVSVNELKNINGKKHLNLKMDFIVRTFNTELVTFQVETI